MRAMVTIYFELSYMWIGLLPPSVIKWFKTLKRFFTLSVIKTEDKQNNEQQ